MARRMNPALRGGARIVAKADGLAAPSIAPTAADRDLWREAVEAGATFADVLSRPGVPLRSAMRLARTTLELADSWREQEGLEPGILDALKPAPAAETPDYLWTPDFLRTQDDWRRELVAAWAALRDEDRAAFLARVGRGGLT